MEKKWIDADALKEWADIVPLTPDGGIDANDLAKKIESMPAADVAPVRHGEWADDASCPFCGFKPWYENDIHTLSFCPNCGARMDGGDGDD